MTESTTSKEVREKMTLVDDLAIVIKRIVRESRAPTTTEAMQIARVLGHCFPTLHENHLLFSAFVNALPVGVPEPSEF